MNEMNAFSRPPVPRNVQARSTRWPWSTPHFAAAASPLPRTQSLPVPSVASVPAPNSASRPASSPQSRAEPVAKTALASARLLVVDDEQMIALNLQRLLTRRGYDVEAFTDPLEARARFEAEPDAFDLVISDLAMPGLRGEDLAGHILEIRPNVPVLIYTGFLDTAAQIRLDALPVRRVLSKPTPLSEIAEVIAEELAAE